MTAMILDPLFVRLLIDRRSELGHDRYDEVWNGVYVVPPMPYVSQQQMVGDLGDLFGRVAGRRATVLYGCNVSGRDADWQTDYRIPDVVVALLGSRAIARDTHYFGGPDLVVEFRCPEDDSFQKLDFYAAVGVREVLVVERDSREPHLFRLGRKKLSPVKPTAVGGEPWLVSEVLPLAFARADTKAGPKLLVRRTAGAARTWRV